MMTNTFTNRPSGKHESCFYPLVICIKDPIAYVYLQIGPYTYLGAYSLCDSINFFAPNIIFILDFKGTCQTTHHTLKGLYYIEITNIPLALSTTHNKHAYSTLEFRVYIPYYLNVTAFPPKKNLVPRFGSRRRLNDQIWELVERKVRKFC
jgi:hypothetical protein